MIAARIHHQLILIGLILIAACGTDVVAQRPGDQDRGGQRPGDQDRRRERPGTPRPPGPGFRGPGGGPGRPGGGDPIELLQRPDVQAELELLEEQRQESRGLMAKIAARRREVFGQFGGQPQGENLTEKERQARRDRMQQASKTLNDEIEESLWFLLPEQRKRLSQLEVQWQMRGGGGLGALASREVGDKLQITDEQRNQLRALGQEWGQQLQKLQLEFRQKLLGQLDPQQRAKFQQMVGDPFEFRDQGPGRPGGGGPGGPRPGGVRPGGAGPGGTRPGGARPQRPPSN